MKVKPVEIDRASYKKVKNMNREELAAFLTELYTDGMYDGVKSVVTSDELREVIGGVSGIGEARLNQIMEALKAHYITEK